MKKILLSIIFLFFIISLAQGSGITVTNESSPAGNYCDTCPDIAGGGDQVCEQPDGTSSGLCGWAITETGGATGDVNFAATPDDNPALGCLDIPMTYAITFTKTNTDPADMYASKATSATANYIQFYFKLNALTLGWGHMNWVISLAESDHLDSSSVFFGLFQEGELSDDFRLFGMYHLLAGWQLIDNSNATIALDTWYGIRLKVLDPAGGGSDSVQWWIDYDNDGTFDEEQLIEGLTLNRTIGAIVLGTISPQSGSDEIQTYTITGIRIDDDSMPSGCVRELVPSGITLGVGPGMTLQ